MCARGGQRARVPHAARPTANARAAGAREQPGSAPEHACPPRTRARRGAPAPSYSFAARRAQRPAAARAAARETRDCAAARRGCAQCCMCGSHSCRFCDSVPAARRAPRAARAWSRVPDRARAGRTFHVHLVAGRLCWLSVHAHSHGLRVHARSQLCLQVYQPGFAVAADAGQRGLCDGIHAHVLVGQVAVSRRSSGCLGGRGRGPGSGSDRRPRPVLFQFHRVLGRLPTCGRQRAGRDRRDSAGRGLCAGELVLPVQARVQRRWAAV